MTEAFQPCTCYCSPTRTRTARGIQPTPRPTTSLSERTPVPTLKGQKLQRRADNWMKLDSAGAARSDPGSSSAKQTG